MRSTGRRGPASPEADVELQLRAGAERGAPVALRSYARVAAGGVARKALAWSFAQGGPSPVTVSLAPPDALDLDDARTAVVGVPREVRALVVNGAPSAVRHRDEAFFVEAALASPASPVRPTVIDAGALATARLDGFDVVLLLGVRSPGVKSAELRAFVERGGGLLVALGDEVDPERYEAELGSLLPRPLHVVKTVGDPGAPAPRRAAGPLRRGGRGAPGAARVQRAGARGARRHADLALRAPQAGAARRRRARARLLRRRGAGAGGGAARGGDG